MPDWEVRAVEPRPLRVRKEPVAALSPTTVEIIGVMWEGKPMALDDFLDTAGATGWQIAGVGNIDERHHRLYLQRRRPSHARPSTSSRASAKA